jgi:hypothetical protein
MKQKTALQQLINDFTELSKKEGDSGFVGGSVLAIVKNKNYLEIEKEQITDAYLEGGRKGFNFFGDDFEKYYEETYTQSSE